MIYFLYSLIVILLVGIDYFSKKPNYVVRWSIPVLLALLVGLRGANVGVDTANYYNHYYFFGKYGCDFVEPGFDWINRFCYAMHWESWTFFLIMALLTIIPVNIVLSRLKKKEYAIGALLFYLTTFSTLCNGIRQTVACGVFFLMVYYFQTSKDNIWSIAIYCLGIGLSSLIHISALLLLPAFLFKYISLDKRVYLIAYLFSFIFLFIDISPYIPSITLGKRDYGQYVEHINIEGASTLGFLITTLVGITTLLLMFMKNAFKKYPLISNMAFLSFVLRNVGYNYPIISRVTMYFTWFIILVVAILYYEDRKKGKIKVYTIAYVALFMMYAVLALHSYTSSRNQLLPYTTYWQNDEYGIIFDK